MGDDAQEWNGSYDPLADLDDRRVLLSALDSFSAYHPNAHRLLHRKRQNFYALPSSHWQRLAEQPISLLETFNAVEHAVDKNAQLALRIFENGLHAFGLADTAVTVDNDGALTSKSTSWRGSSSESDQAKATTIIRQLYRDWSSEGEQERSACHGPILSSIEKAFVDVKGKEKIRVLVPGAGLGRLVFDLCAEGYTVEGNEISYHALLTSSFMLNHCSQAKEFELYPWALGFSNHLKREHQLACVKIPDVHPGQELARRAASGSCGSMSMSAADFCVSYCEESARDMFDVVATVFFIDTAPDFLRYMTAVKNCLRKGGIWTNVGPLLWHFEAGRSKNHDHGHPESGPLGIGEAGSVELADDEIMHILENSGFSIEYHSTEEKGGYIQNTRSMLQNIYNLSAWVARKV